MSCQLEHGCRNFPTLVGYFNCIIPIRDNCPIILTPCNFTLNIDPKCLSSLNCHKAEISFECFQICGTLNITPRSCGCEYDISFTPDSQPCRRVQSIYPGSILTINSNRF